MTLAQPPSMWLPLVFAGHVVRGFAFALAVESIAVASYVLPTVSLAAVTLVGFGLPPALLGDPFTWLIACLGLGGFMVALHVVWALALEAMMLVLGQGAWWRQGALLAAYSCGWDLLTSPCGVALAWLSGGRAAVARLLGKALANPRATSLEYLVELRGQQPGRALGMAVIAAVFSMLFAAGVAVAAGLQAWPEAWQLLLFLM